MDFNANNIKKIYLKFLIFSIILVLTYVSIDYLFYANSTQKIAINNAVNKIKEREMVFNHFITGSKRILYSLRNNQDFIQYIEKQNNKKDVEDMFLTFSKSQKDFMQLRYIDKDGFEKIRIDKDIRNDTSYLVEKSNLQNKANRYYFSDSITKPYEEVWFSLLDLNIENGKIQTPYNPTLRAILPIEHNNEFRGIVIINYLMDDFLNDFLNISFYDAILFDEKGYILKHYNNSKNWSFYKKEKFNISKEYPDEYKEIFSNKTYKTNNYVTSNLSVPTGNQLYLLLKLKNSYIKKQHIKQIEHYIIVATITFILSLITTILIGKRFALLINIIENKNKEQKSLLSLFDHGDSVLFKWNNDENWSIDYVSSNVKNLLGYSRDQFLSSEVVYKECIFKDDLNRIFNEVQTIDKLSNQFLKHEPYRIITKDGTTKWVLDYTVLEKNSSGNITHFLGYIIDITEREKIYRNLQKFINTQDNIVILTDGKGLHFSNKEFFNFFGFRDLEKFKMKHKCICEFFNENDKFFHLGKVKDDKNWVDVLQTLPSSQRIVSMLNSDLILHVFSVSINKFDDKLQIISFTDISQTILKNIELEEKVVHDQLTGAFNREYFEQNYQNLINNYEGSGYLFGLALLDIDHFKIVNDTYGHDVGDDVLQHFVDTIHKFSREDDIFVRWGGEEFIFILKIKSKENLEKVLEHIRKVIELEEFETIGHKTCSIGGTFYKNNEKIEDTIKRADIAVYEAKETGRNKVVIIE